MKYKLSKYIQVKEKGNYVLIYAMISDCYFALTRDRYDLLFQEDLYIVEKKNKNLFSAMKKLNVIIPCDLNEIELLQMNNRKQVFSNQHYKLTINPTLECNFKCWYCYEEHPKGHMSKNVMTSIVRHIKKMIFENGIKHIELDWFGGEPLLYYDEVMLPLSRKIISVANKNNVTFSNSITTNGYLINAEKIASFFGGVL